MSTYKSGIQIAKNSVYKIKSVLKYIYLKSIIDIAVIEVEKDIPFYFELADDSILNTNYPLNDMSIALLGYPLGTALSRSANADINKIYQFNFNVQGLHAYLGMSGGPVLNSEDKVAGVTSSSSPDFSYDNVNNCVHLNQGQEKSELTYISNTKFINNSLSLEELLVLEVLFLSKKYAQAQTIKPILSLQPQYDYLMNITNNSQRIQKLILQIPNWKSIKIFEINLGILIKAQQNPVLKDL